MNRLKKIILAVGLILGIWIIYYNRYFFESMLSFIESYLTPPDLKYVRENEWIHVEGFKFGGLVEFDSGAYQLKADTIFMDGKPRAIVVGTNSLFYEMRIKSIDGKVRGTYQNTDELTN